MPAVLFENDVDVVVNFVFLSVNHLIDKFKSIYGGFAWNVF